jgi:hypothetical protein
MLITFSTNSSTPNPTNPTNAFNNNPNILLDVAKTPIVSTHKKIGILF